MAKKITAESGLQLLARLSSRPSLSQLDSTLFPAGLQPGDLIQISGESGTGKSLLLLHLLAKCILSKSYKHYEIGGLGVGAILIDTDHNISLLKLASLMEHCIINSITNSGMNSSVKLSSQEVESYMEDIIKESMNRLIILKTYSSVQLQMNFHSLGKILSSNTNVSLLIIDSLTSYYWQDTMNQKNYKKMDLYLKVMLQNLQKCIKDFKIVTMFVKPEYFQSKRNTTKLSEINYKIDLKKSDRPNNLFSVLIDSKQCSHQFSISNKGITWIVN